MTAAEELEVYNSYTDEETWEDVFVGNGITTLGVEYAVSEGFTFNSSFSTTAYGAALSGTNIAISPITDKASYVTDETFSFRLAYRVNPNTSGTFTLSSASVDGVNSGENNATWSYHTSKNNIELTNLNIPSYVEW